ncbi:MAG: hypothetical protein KJ915_13070 [Candidatus Omnitrophica bacterium]|nr:hypothetical protein [Candidatus Omnitrophota bacterium]
MQSNLVNYLQIFFRRKHLFLYPFLLTVTVVVIASFVLPKTYVSSSVILIEEEDVINPLISGLAVSTTVVDRLRILREQILSWKSLTELTKRLNLDAAIKSQYSYEEFIKDLRKNITVESRGEQLVMIAYSGENPETVQQVAKTLTDIFIQQNVDAKTRETHVAVSFLEDQLKLYRHKIKSDEIKNLQDQLDQLLVDSTVKHPMVQNLQSRIDKLKTELDKDEIDVRLQAQKPLADKDMLSYMILKELKKGDDSAASDSVSDMANNLSLNLNNRAGMALDATVNEDVYAMLLKRLETARITQKLDTFKEGTRFTVIDPPRLPLKPSKPDPIKFLMMGLVLGAGIGYGCIFLAEMLDRSYKNIYDVKGDMTLPILGAISTIITEDEFQKTKKGAKFTYLMMALFFGLLIVMVLVFSMVR